VRRRRFIRDSDTIWRNVDGYRAELDTTLDRTAPASGARRTARASAPASGSGERRAANGTGERPAVRGERHRRAAPASGTGTPIDTVAFCGPA